MQKIPEQILELAVEVAALRYACTKALALLQNGDAEAKDADRVKKLLETVLRG
jgi:hypothetical protein